MEITVFGQYTRDSVVELTGDAEELDIQSDESSLAAPVAVTCRLHRDGEILRIEGEVRARFNLQCARCLDPLVVDASGAFTIVVKRLPLGAPVPVDSADVDEMEGETIMYMEHHVNSLDITGQVRDAVILSLPMKILCAEECRGLCPSCGRNLNEGDCNCAQAYGDPRWGALEKKFGENI